MNLYIVRSLVIVPCCSERDLPVHMLVMKKESRGVGFAKGQLVVKPPLVYVAERIRETKLSEITDADADRHILCLNELTSARSV